MAKYGQGGECSLEPPSNTVVYLMVMISLNKTNRFPESAALPSFRQRLSYFLALLFVFVSLNPAQAGMTMGQGTTAATMDMSASTLEPAMAFSEASSSEEQTDEGASLHRMNMAKTIGPDDECQSDCDCCPGLCSVYLPSYLNASTFLPANFTPADSAILGKVSTSTTLFRPPISH